MPEPPPPPIPFPDYLPTLDYGQYGLFIVLGKINGITNTVGQIYANTIRVAYYNGIGVRWNGEEFESVETGSRWAVTVKNLTGLDDLATGTHIDLESLPTQDDISYRAVPAEP